MKKLLLVVVVLTFVSRLMGGIEFLYNTHYGNVHVPPEYQREEVDYDIPVSTYEENDEPVYVEPVVYEPEATSGEWSDEHDTAPAVDTRSNGEGYLGGWTTADGSSDIYFYEVDGQRYYYGTIYGVYYEGTVEVYNSHGAIYCMDGSRNDGTIAVAFYMAYNEYNEMSPYELYEQEYGTGFYWHHQ